MKTKIFTTLLGCAFSVALFAQPLSCPDAQAGPQQAGLPGYKLLMHRDGNLWTIHEDQTDDWYISIGGLWMSARTPDQTLRVAGYDNSGIVIQGDFWPGPLQSDGLPNPGWCDLFDRVWRISAAETDAFIADWEDNGQLDNPIPEAILTWPGSGNPHYAQNGFPSMPAGDLAPFADRNSNQIYEPLQGDYPLIKGDAALWKMINDNGSVHGITQGQPLMVQTSIMAYSYDDPDPLLSSAVFYQLSVQNKNPEALLDLKTGIWLENNWECPLTQRWTVVPDQDLAYFFNTYQQGDSCEISPLPSIPEWNYWLGLKLLQSPLEKDPIFQSRLSGLVYFRNLYYNAPAPETTAPLIDVGYHRYLSNQWADGSPFTYGADAYQAGTPYPFVFPDPMHDTLGWSACTADWPDYFLYSLVNIPLGDFAPGEKKTFDLALFRIPEPETPCKTPFTLSLPGDQLQEFWENEAVSITEATRIKPDIRIYPNPARRHFSVHIASGTPVQWTVWNSQGIEMGKGPATASGFQIHAEGWPKGIYLVGIKMENGGLFSTKVVIE